MLSDSPVSATLPAVDLDRARQFYEAKLGLKVINQFPFGLVLGAGQGTSIVIYQRGQTKADHTAATFSVQDIEATVKDLTAKGVRFEQYNLEPGPKTNNLGISAGPDGGKAAWFKDTEGNILGLVQM